MRRKIRGNRTRDIIRNRRRNVGGKYYKVVSKVLFNFSFFFFFLSPDLSRFSRIFILILWIMEMDWILIVGMYAGGTFVSLQNCFIRNTFD